jgi:site-specific recombinase XerD
MNYTARKLPITRRNPPLSDPEIDPKTEIKNTSLKPADLAKVLESWENYLSQKGGIGTYTSFKNYKAAVNTFIRCICTTYPEMPISEFAKEHADEYRAWLGQRYKVSSIRVKLAGVIKFWEYLQDLGVVTQNPFNVPKLQKRFGKELHPFTEAEDKDFLFSLYDLNDNKFDSHVVAMLVIRFAGLTIAEAFHLRPADIVPGLGGHTLRIHIHRGKWKPERTAIFLPNFNRYGADIYNYLDYVWNFLQGRKKHSPLIYVKKRGFIDFNTKMVEKGSLPKGFTTIRLRDTYIHWLSKLGVTDLTLSVLLNHKKPESLEYYDQKLTAVDNIERLLLWEIQRASGGFNMKDGKIQPRDLTKVNDQEKGV